MPLVSLKHSTSYAYAQPVALGEHRLMVRPCESFDQRLIEASLSIVPGAERVPLAARCVWQRGRAGEVFGALARAAHREHDLGATHAAGRRRDSRRAVRATLSIHVRVRRHARSAALDRARSPRSPAHHRRVGARFRSQQGRDRHTRHAAAHDRASARRVHVPAALRKRHPNADGNPRQAVAAPVAILRC